MKTLAGLTAALCVAVPGYVLARAGLPSHNPVMVGGSLCADAEILDRISATPTIAVSVRKLRAAYAGAAFRVVRNSDSTQHDIGFDTNCYSDIADLLAFCAATDCEVVKYYDQSGNANDLVVTANPLNPLVVNGGSIATTIGSKSKLAFQMGVSHTNALRLNNSFATIGTTAGAVFASANATNGDVGDATASWWQLPSLLGVNNGNPNGLSLNFGFVQGGTLYNPPSFQGTRYHGSWLTSHTDMFESVTYTYGTDGIFTMRWKTTDPAPTKVYVNGGTPGLNSNTAANDAPGNPAFILGEGGEVSFQQPFVGSIGEVFVFAVEPSLADSNTLGGNMSTYYGLTWANIIQ